MVFYCVKVVEVYGMVSVPEDFLRLSVPVLGKAGVYFRYFQAEGRVDEDRNF